MAAARVASVALVALVVALPARAQPDAPLPSRPIAMRIEAPLAQPPAQMIDALERWTADYDAWSVWFAQWRNRREPGWISSRERRPFPVPPAWLGDLCAGGVEEEGVLGEACRAWRASRRDVEEEAAAVAAQAIVQARADQEAPQKTAWWSRVHLDGIWPMTRSGSSAFGVFGVHTAMPVSGRFQVFLAPGVILMRLPSTNGGSELTAATDWGFSYRLFDFRLPAARRATTMHFNLARVWLLGQHTVQIPGDLYVAGFSLTFKQR
jgi:hypothetical protein